MKEIMNIFLIIIIKFTSIKSDCYSTCFTCSDPANSNINEMYCDS